jgi:hypothetical protein
VIQITSQLSSLLSSVRSLRVEKGHELPAGEEDVDSTQWLELFQLFTHVTRLTVADVELVPGIVQALVAEGTTTEVLPELTSLHLRGRSILPSAAKAAELPEQFVTTRKLSGRTVHLSAE